MGMEALVGQRLWGALALVLACGMVPAGASAPVAQSDLDAFMKDVMLRRADNWKKFQQYLLDEREQIEFRGPGKLPLWGDRRDYTWYLRDGFFVRSPVRANGVTVSEDDRRKYEDEFLRRQQARDKRRVALTVGTTTEVKELPPPERSASIDPDESADAQGLIRQTREPQFISSAYFLKFKFEEGKYTFVGREKIEGRDVLKIEYFPAMLFSKEQNSRQHRRDMGQKTKEDNEDAAFERMLNKVSLVTLWVEPASHQIVKYNFNNVNVDFLPAAWLARLTDLRATMTMHQPFPDVWLPKDVDFYFSAMLAIGEMDARYRLTYHDYKLAIATARIK